MNQIYISQIILAKNQSYDIIELFASARAHMCVFTTLTFETVDGFLRKFVRILRHWRTRPNTVTYESAYSKLWVTLQTL
jgi:hypothetical protein